MVAPSAGFVSTLSGFVNEAKELGNVLNITVYMYIEREREREMYIYIFIYLYTFVGAPFGLTHTIHRVHPNKRNKALTLALAHEQTINYLNN